MIVPDYWAESKKRHQNGKRQITVLRYGWSTTTQEDAAKMAEERANDALQRVIRGEKIAPKEWKTAYNGADGIPIREEVLSRHGQEVITRNSYGAHCLNTPIALFGDVDFSEDSKLGLLIAIVLFVVAFCAGYYLGGSFRAALSFSFISLLASAFLNKIANLCLKKSQKEKEREVRQKLVTFHSKHADWNIRLYESPAGYRVLATHKPFDPNSEEVRDFFHAIGADPVYIRMCQNQKCFRARLTGKPWRMGISSHMRPRPGVWPVRPERMQMRNQWIKEYEAQAVSYSACRYIESFGSGVIHDRLKNVVQLHDSQSRAMDKDSKLA